MNNARPSLSANKMNIGGWEKTSFCDFPGKLSTVVFTQGCNFNCPFCHNRRLISAKPRIQNQTLENQIRSYLVKRKNLIEAVVISGGEPALQPGLERFIAEIKSMNFQVKLDTNGSYPLVIKKLIEQRLVDFIAMDVKAPWDKYNLLCGRPVQVEKIRESIQLISLSGIPFQFRTTWYQKLLTEEDLNKIKEQLPMGKLTVQDYKMPTC